MASKSKMVKAVNLRGEVIEIVNLIRDINYKAIKKRTKRLIKKKGRYGKPQSLIKALGSPFLRQWFKVISNELM